MDILAEVLKQRLEQAQKVAIFMEVAVLQFNVDRSYLSKLWINPNWRLQAMEMLFKFHCGEKNFIETFNAIRLLALQVEAVHKFTELRDGLLKYHLHALTAYMNDEDPLDSDTTDEESWTDDEDDDDEPSSEPDSGYDTTD